MKFRSAFAATSIAVLSGCGAGYETAAPRAPVTAQIANCPPVLNGDGTVTFRYCRPAESVTWATPPAFSGTPRSQAMAQDLKTGVWSATVALPNNLYNYTFTVDGVSGVHDPSNLPFDDDTESSQFFVPGSNSPQASDEHYASLNPGADVPHGAVTRHYLYTPTSEGSFADGHHPLTVYTPPGYGSTTKTYPVLYLVHGGTQTDVDWVTAGAAASIADYLIGTGAAEPMVIALPNFYHLDGCSNADRGGNTVNCDDPTVREADTFLVELKGSFIPFVEANYRVRTDRAGRAYAGLSQGAAYGNHIIINAADLFAFYGIWSPACVFVPYADCGRSPTVAELSTPQAQSISLVHFGAGPADQFGAYGTVRTMEANLTAAGIAFRRHNTPDDMDPAPPAGDSADLGMHSWQSWREQLRDALSTIVFRS